jgi:hypothetical protein
VTPQKQPAKHPWDHEQTIACQGKIPHQGCNTERVTHGQVYQKKANTALGIEAASPQIDWGIQPKARPRNKRNVAQNISTTRMDREQKTTVYPNTRGNAQKNNNPGIPLKYHLHYVA